MNGPQNMREDGQPAGGFMPKISLPIQRLRGENTTFEGVVRIGDEMTRKSEIAEIDIDDQAARGPLVSLMFRQTLSGPAGVAVVEERRFLYFGTDYRLDTSTPELPVDHVGTHSRPGPGDVVSLLGDPVQFPPRAPRPPLRC